MRRLPATGPILILIGHNWSASLAVAAEPSSNRLLRPADTSSTVASEVRSQVTVRDASQSEVATLLVEVVPGSMELDVEEIRSAIASELSLPITTDSTQPYVGKVSVDALLAPVVRVRYESKDGTTKLERRGALPVDRNKRSVVVAWVIGNLVRNEAAEILAGMTQSHSPGSIRGGSTEAVGGSEAGAANSESAARDASDSDGRTATIEQNSDRPIALRGDVRVAGTVAPRDATLLAARVLNLALYAPQLALGRDAERHRYALSVGALYSRVGALSGVGFTLLVDRIERRSKGVVVAGLWSQTDEFVGTAVAGLGIQSSGTLRGADISGLVALRQGCVVGAQVTGIWASANDSCLHSKSPIFGQRRALEGAQIAGIIARLDGGFRGAQVAGAGAFARDDFDGVQSAFGLTYSRGSFVGGQLALGANFGLGDMRGIQLAGGFNHVARDAHGAQVAMGFNSARDIRGMQLAFVNSARDVSGLQVGFVNVAKKRTGLALGLFNWSEGARLQPTYFFQTPGLHNLGYRNVAGHSSSSLSFGYDPINNTARTHFAVGVRGELGRFAVAVESGYGWVLENFSNGPRRDRAHELDLIATGTLELVPGVLSIYGGGGVAQPVAGRVEIEPRGLAQAGVSLF